MGNSATNSHASVLVALERGQYHAGGVVRGYVQVSVQSQFSCSDVYAIFHGDVRTTVHYTTTHTTGSGENRRTVKRHHTAYGRERLVEENRLVARFDGGFANPGLYQFPFEFALHPMLPSSAFVPGRDHAGIAYGVEVKLVRPNIFKWDLVHRTCFDLIAHVPHPITDAMTHDTKSVNCCCCFNKGTMDLGAALQRNAFCANEDIVVSFQVKNDSSSEVQQVYIELMEHIRFRAQGHHASKLHCLARCAAGGVGPDSTLQPKQIRLKLPPAFMHCSLRTGILQIEHYVEIRADTPCCIDNPCLRLPVTLHRSGLASMQVPEMHGDEQMQFDMAAPYQPNPNAMHSPVAVQVQAGPPVAPITAQALQMAPQQGVMAPRQSHMTSQQMELQANLPSAPMLPGYN